jgi:tetratricopeptide (TPR) repeat protein
MLPRARDPDLFARLGVSTTASREEVRSAYFQLAKRFHPDRFAGADFADVRKDVQDLFAALNEAYEVLSDDARRAALLAGGGGTGGSGAAAIDFQKGEACLRTRDLRRARAFYEAAVRADPKPEHVAALAWVLFADGDAEEKKRARQLVVQALRDPRSFRAALVAGLVARSEGQDVVAERHLRAALALDPNHAEAQRELRAVQAKLARRERPRD